MDHTRDRRTSRMLPLVIALALTAFRIDGGEEYKSGPHVVSLPAIDIDFYTPPQEISPLPLQADGKPRNVVLLIGDGMGLAQIALSRFCAVGANGRLHMDRLPITGLTMTNSANALVTDSAAAGTALAAGVKTNNGAIGLKPDGSKVRTLLEMARDNGLATGLVATSTISHATPAAFAAHVSSRGDEADIALQMSASGIDVLLGGGRDFWLPEIAKGKREDNRDLIAAARENGYAIVETAADLAAAKGPKVLGLFHGSSLTTRPPEPALAEMTAKAVEILQQDADGFFLMVEGSQIDWKCHDNNSAEMVRQTLLFDMAVKVVLDFAQKNRETLVIVTADHETGGLAVLDGRLDGKDLKIAWASTKHTTLPVMLYAYGPGAWRFTGVQDNTEVAVKIAHLLGWPLTDAGSDGK